MSISVALTPLPSYGASRHVELFGQRVEPAFYCDGKIDLRIASEFFVELANTDPGINEYNVLIGHYRKKEWARLDQGIQAFLTDFESTPLREAVAFLKVQAAWERLTPESTDADRMEAEKMMREVTLLYPKSVLAPVITATFGAHHLAKGHVEKSLSIYSDARDRYPFSELACVFQMGVGESNFHLKNGVQARRSFEQVLQKCENPRLRSGAQIRIAESIQAENPKSAENGLMKVMNRDAPFVYRFHPEALFNLGEMKYRRNDLDGAKHFFTEAAKHAEVARECQDVAMERLASVELRKKSPLPEVVGKYLEAHEKAPATDIGRFAYIRALLLELESQIPIERARRIKITDEAIEQIVDRDLQKEAFLEKGIALLQLGEELALPYLARYAQVAGESLKKQNVGVFIREKVGSLLATLPKRMARPLTVDDIGDRLKPFESAYSTWIKGESTAVKAREDVKRFVLDQIARAPEEADRTIGILTRYGISPFKEKGAWTPADSSKLQGTILRALLSDKTKGKESLVAKSYKPAAETLAPWLGNKGAPIQLVIAYQLQDQDALIRTVRKGRGLASIAESSVVLDGRWTPEYQIAVAEALIYAAQYSDAEKIIGRIGVNKHGLDMDDKLSGVKVELYRRTNRLGTAFDLAMARFQKAKKEEKTARLRDALSIATVGKLWGKSDLMLKSARALKLENTDHASFEFFAGRSHYEAGRFAKAIESYETALSASPDATEAPEARYRLGKSFWIRRDKAKAKQVWQELSTQQDPFWSPLAQNELKLLAP